jgi:hypothetical protein
VQTPRPRELYVEKLVSQSRNAVDSFSGPTTVYVGQTVQYNVAGHTATQGYEQVLLFPQLSVLFRLLSASATYSKPAVGTVNSGVYAITTTTVRATSPTTTAAARPAAALRPPTPSRSCPPALRP